MEEMEPVTDESEGDEVSSGDAPSASPLPLGSHDSLRNPAISSFEFLSIIIYSFVILNVGEGLVQLLFPVATALRADRNSLTSLIRSQGIFSLTIAICTVGYIQSLQKQINMQDAYRLALAFYCIATLASKVFLSFGQGTGLNAYGWVTVALYVVWMVGLVRHRRQLISDV